jgi:ankyrin repeat protein
MKAAARKGHLDMVKYLLRQGYYYDMYTTEEAAKHGHLDCLRYLIDSGCPCDGPFMLYVIVSYGKATVEIVQLLHDNGCPYHKEELYACATNELHDLDVIKYIQDKM